MTNSQFNKLLIVHHTLVLKDAMEVGHNGLMNMSKNTALNQLHLIHTLEQLIHVHMMHQKLFSKLEDMLMLLLIHQHQC